MTPVNESGSAVRLAVFSAAEVAFLLEMIVDRGMDGDEFLQVSHAAKRSIARSSSSNWLM